MAEQKTETLNRKTRRTMASVLRRRSGKGVTAPAAVEPLIDPTQPAPSGLARRMANATAALALTGSPLAFIGNFIFPSGIDYTGGFWSGSVGGALGTFLSIAPQDFDYSQVNPQNSSIVMACLNWICRTYKEAKPDVYLPGNNGDFVKQPNHKATRLLRRPNKFYSYSKLMSGLLVDYFCNGNAYVFKQKSEGGIGQTQELYFVPSFQITPWRLPWSNNLIDFYRYTVNGKMYAIPVDRIIHFRFELDPNNPMQGRRPLYPVFSEIFGDEKAARYTAALLKNMAIPGVAIVPEDDTVQIEDEDAEAAKESFKRKFGGDNVGEPWIANFRAKIQVLGFSPENMNLKDLRRVPEERVSGCLGVPAIVAGLGAGLDRSTYSNFEQAVAHAVQSCLIPLWDDIAETFTLQFLGEFERNPDAEFRFDTSTVKALQENADGLYKRLTSAWVVDLMTRAEVRARMSLPVDEARDSIFYSSIKQANLAISAARFVQTDTGGGAGKAFVKKTPRKNLDHAFYLMLEADVAAKVGTTSEDIDAFFGDLGDAAEEAAGEGVDTQKASEEAGRIASKLERAIVDGMAALFVNIGDGVEDGAIRAVSFTLGISDTQAWSAGASIRFRNDVETRTISYTDELKAQTRQAAEEAIRLAKAGATTEEIAQSIKGFVEGRALYPGIFDEGYNAAKARGASDSAAAIEGEAKAREYRAKVIAETETRTMQNLGVLESLKTAGHGSVRVTDGDGCGWKNHDDLDKADGTTRTIREARKYSLAHPNCKRRFYPLEDAEDNGGSGDNEA